MGKLKDLKGCVFHKLTVLRYEGLNRFNQAMWLCWCECGDMTSVRGSALIAGTTKSCGCHKRAGQYNVVHGHKRTTGQSRAYSSWCNMKGRCTNPNLPQFKDWGGRGITYCKRWETFENFLSDMGEPPEGYTLDRKDNDKGYCKSNCRWADKSTQRRNSRRHMVWVEIEGERMILKDAVAKHKVVSYQSAVNRIHKGWTPEDAVLTPYKRVDNKGYRP